MNVGGVSQVKKAKLNITIGSPADACCDLSANSKKANGAMLSVDELYGPDFHLGLL